MQGVETRQGRVWQDFPSTLASGEVVGPGWIEEIDARIAADRIANMKSKGGW